MNYYNHTDKELIDKLANIGALEYKLQELGAKDIYISTSNKLYEAIGKKLRCFLIVNNNPSEEDFTIMINALNVLLSRTPMTIISSIGENKDFMFQIQTSGDNDRIINFDNKTKTAKYIFRTIDGHNRYDESRMTFKEFVTIFKENEIKDVAAFVRAFPKTKRKSQ